MILNHRGVFTTGIDESRQMSRQAHKRLLKQGGSYKLANGMGQALPFADSSFGSVVSTYPAPYIFEHITLNETYRVLNPGGELLIMLTVYFLGDGILKNFWAWIFRGALNPDADFTTVRQRFEGFPWQVEVLTRVFRDNRLLIIRCKKP